MPLFLYGQSIHFFRETIHINLTDDHCQVKGIYYFKNLNNYSVTQNLSYPFAVNNALPFPDSITVKDSLKGQKINYVIGKSRVNFLVKVPPKSVAIYTVYFRQRTPERQMEYLLTTTQNWNRPLDRADFYIKRPKHLNIVKLSHPFELQETGGDHQVYVMRKEHFMPHNNLKVQWAGKK
ncbi:MAG: DUF4424 domain-containing protein [Caldithrix sp.]|nr:DUF4424 domain-containing protein [Caldithrix sp.]